MTAFFRNVYGASKSIDITVPPDVPDDLGLLEINDQLNWILDDLVAPASTNEELKARMQTLKTKLSDYGKAPVTAVRDVIDLASKIVELSESLRISEYKFAVASL